MDDTLIKWMIKFDGSAAAKELATFAGATEDQLNQIDANATKALDFANKMGWATQASPALGKVLEEMAAVRKSAFGVDTAMQLAARSSAGFEDLANQLATINQLFKDGMISAEAAQRSFGKVGIEGNRRTGEAAQLADDNARIEEAHWAKIDKEREEAAKRLVKISQENLVNEESHWAQIDRERERAAVDLAKKMADAEALRAGKVRQSISELKTMAGLGVAGGLALIGSSARSGFQDTLQGQQSAAYGQLLNRQVASIFAPLLEEKTKYVSQMTSWLQGLSEPQKKSIVAMTVFGTSMTALTIIVPKALKAMAALATEGALGGTLARMTAQGGALGGVAAMAGPIGMALAGTAAILASSEKGREALAEMAKAFEPLIPVFAGVIEALTPVISALATTIAELVKFLQGKGTANAVGRAATSPFGGFNLDEDRRKREQDFWDRKNSMPWLFGSNAGPRPLDLANAGSGAASAGLSGIPKGLEDIGRDFERILEASTKMDLQQRQVTLLEEIRDNTRRPELPLMVPGAGMGMREPIGH